MEREYICKIVEIAQKGKEDYPLCERLTKYPVYKIIREKDILR